ncbi:hypothetical protein UA08_08034 [Talaromyces atroroseus]|uniref:Uncharacterized protein n=1 Tax=Talaromyces atroroseus TaxID=1441469 RepID=A0A225A828_TALAT|nr:hypothetical protein UA08_08034 [Talaromyces atroroseus]OKL56722.1 hypothetical protein UA08_08034 [Talaromyces atroroseus]
MVLARYSYVFLCLVCCVSADEWSDLENDLVTDLAPLISLFGEQVTTQCMSELITALDDYIFALAPIGILTALVSLIRICGNSTLRAFIGRASEDPGDSELELLSCVSDTTAEVFTESGVARITGNPKILEVVANESGTVTVQKVSELEGKRWTDLEKDATLPNLSLNKGIKRRAPFWFHLAALFGTILQLDNEGVIIYAALTVFKWPEFFLKDGARANSYAFPMFAIGTAILTLGMFFCALLLERFSKKRFLTLPKESRVYWIQPGNQGVGDQKLPSFVGQTDKGAHFTRSVRHHSPDEVLNIIFHLFTIRSFRIRSVSSLPMQEPQPQSDSVVRESLIVREKLTKLAGSHWNKTPARKLAQNLGQATQELMKLISSWSDKDVTYFDIVIPLELEKEGSQQTIQYDKKMRLSSGAKVDVDLWEAILGLYVWSLRQANREMGDEHGNHFFRALESRNKNAHQARLLYQKWTNDESALRQNQAAPTTFLNGSNKFGKFDYRTENPADSAALVGVSCDLYTLAAQDIYMHVLSSMLEWLSEIGGTTQISGKEKKTYRLSNDRIEVLTEGFVKSGLGDQRGSAVCILSVLSDRGLLPEITIKSVEVQQQLGELESLNDQGIFGIREWLCSVADFEEVEHMLVEYGYICLRHIMSRYDTGTPLGLKKIMSILNVNHNSQLPNSISKDLANISSIPGADWQERYRNEMYWISSRLLRIQAAHSHSDQDTLYLNELEKLYAVQCSMEETYTDQEAALSSQSALLDVWLELVTMKLSNNYVQIIFDWLIKNKHHNILEWFIMRMLLDTFSSNFQNVLTMMITYSAAIKYDKPVEILLRHIDSSNLRALIIMQIAVSGDVQTLEFLLGRNLSVGSGEEHEAALFAAVERNQYSVVKFLLEGGVNVDAKSINGQTALMIAAEGGHVEITSLLFHHNASLEIHSETGNTALILATTSGKLNVVELLVNKGADVNAIGFRGKTALMAATLNRNLPLVKYLCDHKADIQTLGYDQMSVLDVAAHGDEFEGSWTEGYEYLERLGAKRYYDTKYRGY